MTHTKGPWKYKKAKVPNGIEKSMDWGIADTENFCIAEAFEKVGRTGQGGFIVKDAEANARLIAAAPELLDALEGILDIGKRDMSNPKYDGYFNSARLAISKAKGQP